MSTTEERLKILNMIAEGKITAEEGSKLLSALKQTRGKQRSGNAEGIGTNTARFLRISVTEIETGRVKVNVSLPIGLVDVGLRMGARFVPDMEELDLEDLSESIREGMRGKVIDVEDNDSGEHVEVYLE